MTNYASFSDKELVQFLNLGQEIAFNEIYNRYWSGVYLIARNRLKNELEAQEIVQDIFSNLWRKRATLHLEKGIRTYLSVAVKYEVINRSAKNRRDESFLEQFFKDPAHDIDNSTLQMLSFNELKESLEKSVRLLPERCQLVFRLRLEKDYSQKEIAEELDISEKTVEAHLAKARKHIRTSLGSTLPFHIIIFLNIILA